MLLDANGALVAEFPQNDPALVLIQRHGNSWEDGLGVKTETEMNARLAIRDTKYQNEWGRRKKGPEPKPRYKKPGHGHPPVILTKGEWVRFECEQPFLVLVMPEPNLDLPVGNPSSPFEGTDPDFPFSENSRPDANGRHFVQKQVTAASLEQLFYKQFFIVLDRSNKKPELVDPDFFCDR